MQFKILTYEDGDLSPSKQELSGGFNLAVQTAATLIVQRFRKLVIAERSVKVETLYLSDTEWSATIMDSIGNDKELYGVTVQRAEADT